MDNTFAELYAPRPDIPFAVKYRATCHCAAVRYEVSADPVVAKMCHCATCQYQSCRSNIDDCCQGEDCET